MESRLLSHSAAGPSCAREALVGPATLRANAKPLCRSINNRNALLHIVARATAPSNVRSNGAPQMFINGR